MSSSKHIPTREAARLAGLDPVVLWKLARRGAFTVSKGWGGKDQIERQPFLDYLAQRQAEARQAPASGPVRYGSAL
jgi:hypothetical protein